MALGARDVELWCVESRPVRAVTLLLEISASKAMQGTICVNSVASCSGWKMACQQRVRCILTA
jgi:uncharacterized protein (DUF2141 family)